ncbi:MAG: DUF1592 domain-containing protein [Pirellulaceae bacterium]
MFRHSLLLFVCLALVGPSASSSLAQDAVAPPDSFEAVIQPFLRQHCVGCHGAKKQQADLRLDALTADFDATDQAAIWIEVMDNLNLGEMPPAERPRPDAAAHRQVVQWIAEQLRAARKRAVASGGRVLMRRLNRTEFSNTLRDLLEMEFLPGEDPAELLPPDATFDGFDKVGSALMLDPSLLENYYEAARRVAERAIVTGPPPFKTHRIRFQMEDMAKPGSGFSYVCGHDGTECGEQDVRLLLGNTRTARGLLYPGTDQIIPVNGMYTIRVRASADPGDRDAPVRMFVERENGREGRLMEVEVTASRDDPQVYSVTLPLDALHEARGVYMKVGIVEGTKLHVGMKQYNDLEQAVKEASTAGDHAAALRLQARMRSEGWVGRNRPAEVLLDPSSLPKLFIDWIEIEGPLYPQWPPRSHEILFGKGEVPRKDAAYAREIFSRFLPRAYRRPATKAEVERIVGLVQRELERGASFEDAIRLGVTYTLTSSSFLYLAEPNSAPQPRTLNDYELASRLSYFLWSSMPDERLFELAASGRLSDAAVLTREVGRMLDDPKSQAMVEGFAAQWLRTEEFLEFTPDRKIYRDFDPALREHMAGETLAFFEEILRRDLSVMNFLDSDFVTVNEPLAKYYGLDGVEGEAFRRVELPDDSPRGGLLGQAGIHLRGSDGVRTKPVNRGVYVREVLFNDPPDPPPPNVGEVEPNIEGERLTVRQRLLQHQQIEACASCHRGIDAYGLALENFDVTGTWRTHQNGEDFRGANTPPIDASGKLPNGQTFENFEQFKAQLLKQQDRFRRGLVEKLFVYALGRPATTQDRGTVEQVVAEMADHGDTLRAAILALTSNEAFQTK